MAKGPVVWLLHACREDCLFLFFINGLFKKPTIVKNNGICNEEKNLELPIVAR